MKLNHKLMQRALLMEKTSKLNAKEKQEICIELHKHYSLRELETMTGISKGTIHNWIMGGKYNGIHQNISLGLIYSRLKAMSSDSITDWGRLEMIKTELERLLEGKPKYDGF